MRVSWVKRLLQWLRDKLATSPAQPPVATQDSMLREWAARMIPAAQSNRDDLERGYEALLGLYAKADVIQDKFDFVELAKAMLHWVFIFRDIANIELAILRSVDDPILTRTLQKTHAAMIFAFLESWPRMMDGAKTAGLRKRFPDLGKIAKETKMAFDTFNEKWRKELTRTRQVASGHYKDALDMNEIWRGLTFNSFVELVKDFRELERHFVPYMGETITKLNLVTVRYVDTRDRPRDA